MQTSSTTWWMKYSAINVFLTTKGKSACRQVFLMCMKRNIGHYVKVATRTTCLNALALLKVILKSDLFPQTPRRLKSLLSDDFIVVGNGPSLKETFENHKNIFSKSSVACANDFALSAYFGVIRPDFYFFFDPVYWNSNTTPYLRALIARDLEAFKTQVTWPMTIVMPVYARRWNWFQSLPEINANIKLFYVNSNAVNSGASVALRNKLYRMNLAMPQAQTVLVGMAFWAINMGYKNISFVGADHSWHENVVVGKDNVLYERASHFYEEDKMSLRPLYSDPEETHIFKVHEFFHALSLIFEGHHEVAAYADSVGAKIFNISGKTYIDAYERRSL